MPRPRIEIDTAAAQQIINKIAAEGKLYTAAIHFHKDIAEQYNTLKGTNVDFQIFRLRIEQGELNANPTVSHTRAPRGAQKAPKVNDPAEETTAPTNVLTIEEEPERRRLVWSGREVSFHSLPVGGFFTFEKKSERPLYYKKVTEKHYARLGDESQSRHPFQLDQNIFPHNYE
jgi:hypothetical protein